jgi:hypothetical protein
MFATAYGLDDKILEGEYMIFYEMVPLGRVFQYSR